MFRFTIRDLLWLMVVVAVALGWLLDHWQLRSRGMAAWLIHTEVNVMRQLKLRPGDRATMEMDVSGNNWLKRDDSSKAVELKRP
jgi:hypothetical protein